MGELFLTHSIPPLGLRARLLPPYALTVPITEGSQCSCSTQPFCSTPAEPVNTWLWQVEWEEKRISWAPSVVCRTPQGVKRVNSQWLMRKTWWGFWIQGRGTQKVQVELILKYLPFTCKSTVSGHSDLKIEWREVDTDTVGMSHKWGKKMENPKPIMIICILEWTLLIVRVLLCFDAYNYVTIS